jgi:hypothetical protein
MQAFAAAATIAGIYRDNIWVQIGAYSYAAFIGLGVSLNVHWASDVLAGLLIGIAIGRTVGDSFRELWAGDTEDRGISLYAGVNTIGLRLRI